MRSGKMFGFVNGSKTCITSYQTSHPNLKLCWWDNTCSQSNNAALIIFCILKYIFMSLMFLYHVCKIFFFFHSSKPWRTHALPIKLSDSLRYKPYRWSDLIWHLRKISADGQIASLSFPGAVQGFAMQWIFIFNHKWQLSFWVMGWLQPPADNLVFFSPFPGQAYLSNSLTLLASNSIKND